MLFDLGPDLSDDTLVEMVRLPTRIRNAAIFAGLKTIGDLRETSDETFASIPDLGPGSVKWLRAQLSGRGREMEPSQTLVRPADRAEGEDTSDDDPNQPLPDDSLEFAPEAM